MHFPFHDELNDVFEGDRSIWLKIGGGTLVGGLITLGTIARDRSNTLGGMVGLIAVVVSALIGGCIGLSLSIKDVVRSRRNSGKSVHPLLRLFFGMGVLTVFM